MKNVKISLGLVVLLLAMTSLTAQPHKHERGKGKMEEKLNLSETQQTQLEVLRKDHQRDMQSVKAQLKIKDAALEAAMLEENAKQARSLVKEINALRADVFTQKINHQLAVKAMLDEEQKLVFNEMLQRKDQKFGPGAGERRGPQPEKRQRTGRGN